MKKRRMKKRRRKRLSKKRGKRKAKEKLNNLEIHFLPGNILMRWKYKCGTARHSMNQNRDNRKISGPNVAML